MLRQARTQSLTAAEAEAIADVVGGAMAALGFDGGLEDA